MAAVYKVRERFNNSTARSEQTIKVLPSQKLISLASVMRFSKPSTKTVNTMVEKCKSTCRKLEFLLKNRLEWKDGSGRAVNAQHKKVPLLPLSCHLPPSKLARDKQHLYTAAAAWLCAAVPHFKHRGGHDTEWSVQREKWMTVNKSERGNASEPDKTTGIYCLQE